MARQDGLASAATGFMPPMPPFFRQSACDAGIEVVVDPTHPFHARFREVLDRDPIAAALGARR